ncbi:hypothetical protein BDZ89DRAFT_887995, partial [Hymenopellis radicata]
SSEQTNSWRTRLGLFLEAPLFHEFVITLIVVDAGCVLADLAYTLSTPGCEPPGPEGPQWLEILSLISIVITMFFLVEIPLALWAFGWSYYNPVGDTPHAVFHDFDAVIIITTFVLEIVLKGKERELGTLLVVLRLWRLIKLVGGVTVGAGELTEDDAQELAENRRLVEEMKAQIQTLESENQELRVRL